jgi:hypothetical protein
MGTILYSSNLTHVKTLIQQNPNNGAKFNCTMLCFFTDEEENGWTKVQIPSEFSSGEETKNKQM